MQNLRKEKIISSVIQQQGLSFKYLLTFCLIGLFSFSSNMVLAEPTSFTITGCTVSGVNIDGDYFCSGIDLGVDNCPCYELADGSKSIAATISNIWSYSLQPCSSFSGGGSVFIKPFGDCDITNTTTLLCDPDIVMSNVQYGSACLNAVTSNSIPTLSEWGLIILALLLMTLGTLVLVQPNWRKV